MFNLDFNKNFMNRFFRSVDNVVWDMLSGNIGIKSDDGILTCDLGELDEEKVEAIYPSVNVNVFDQFGMAVPAFAQSIPVDGIALGDIIYSSSTNKPLGWVIKKQNKSFKLLKADGTRSDWSPPKVQLLGFDSGVMVLKSLFTMLPNGSDGVNQMQNMLMPMMAMGMMGDSDSTDSPEMKDMMGLMLMSQMGNMGGAGNGFANMLPMMLMMKTMGK